MTEGRDEISGGEPTYQWPAKPVIIAPDAVPGQLVAWAPYKNFSMRGLMAFVGERRVGKVDIDMTDQAEWFCSLPSDDDHDAVCGSGTVDECKAALIAHVEAWVTAAGLMPTTGWPGDVS